jgi:hypothetical protein
MMMRWSVPVVAGSASIKSGAIQNSVAPLLRHLHPQAAYFFAEGRMRGGLVVFDMADTPQIPQVAEPLFHAYDAAVETVPVMNAEDLKNAFAKLAS